ncbi:Serpin B6 [Clonorchis sinensis]|uniref:Serpin B6 n=2 Tax=Clonorchis sinensis TaxID=79923 RepID=A0A8T1MXB1_CLOSI|nr:Serpin B6 [Clonorchis sinensis]GAA28469.2 serpin B [Clonorchis sinensis]
MASEEVKQSVCNFAVDLYRQIVKKQGVGLSNVFISPLSIYTAVAMTMAGADGQTKNEILTSLHLSKVDNPNEAVGSIVQHYLQSKTGVELALANRLFALRPATVLPEYSQLIGKVYKAATEELSKLPSNDAKREHINKWVAENTGNKITSLLPSGSITNDTVLSVINALYFKGNWNSPFIKERTTTEEFHCLDGKRISVKMMFVKATFGFNSWDACAAQVLRLPFKDTNWHMLIVLPKQNDGLKKVADYLSKPGALEEMLKDPFFDEEIEVFLPKFKIAEGDPLDAKELLIACGVRELFDGNKADLSKLCSSERLHISDVFHKAVLEIDEEGATAAASTGMMVARMMMGPPPFRVDHPFFLAIISDNMVPVFVGHITNPESP